MCATVRDDRRRSFSTDLERLERSLLLDGERIGGSDDLERYLTDA